MKAEKWSTRDPLRKEMAEEKRDARVQEAELEKQRAYDKNAAERHTAGDQRYSAQGPVGAEYPTGVTRGSQCPAGVDVTTGSGRTGVLDADRDRDSPEGGIQEPRVPGGARTAHGSF